MIRAGRRRFKSLAGMAMSVKPGAKVVVTGEKLELADIIRHCAYVYVEFTKCDIDCHGWAMANVNAFFKPGGTPP